MVRVTIALVLLAVLTPQLHGQQAERNTGFLVHQLQVCPYNDMEEVNQLNALLKPIFDELVEEEMIRAWYDLRHAWGDEWNVSLVTVAESHRAWLDYWSEFLRRVNDRHPTLFDELFTFCTIHKDNMYSVRDSGGDS